MKNGSVNVVGSLDEAIQSLKEYAGSAPSMESKILAMVEKEKKRIAEMVERDEVKRKEKEEKLRVKLEKEKEEAAKWAILKAEMEEKNAVVRAEIEKLESERLALDERIKELKRTVRAVRADGKKNDTFWRKFTVLADAEKFLSECESKGFPSSIIDHTDEEVPYYHVKFRDITING